MELVVLDGSASPRRFVLHGPTMSIGRAPDNDIVLDDPEASRHHAEITWVAGKFVVRDVQAANPTLLNDHVLTHPRALRNGDLLVIGGVLLQVEAPEVTAPPAPVDQGLVDEPMARAEPAVELPPVASKLPARPASAVARPTADHRPATCADSRPGSIPAQAPSAESSAGTAAGAVAAAGRPPLRTVALELSAANARVRRTADRLASELLAIQRRQAEAARIRQLLDEIAAQHAALGGDAMLQRLVETVQGVLDNQTNYRELWALGREASLLGQAARMAQASLRLGSLLRSSILAPAAPPVVEGRA